MSYMHLGDWQIYDPAGRRKYLTADERQRFLAATDGLPADRRALCYVLAFTGCRISEALELTHDRLEPERGIVIFRTLKRRRTVFRTVPVPVSLIEMLVTLTPCADGRFWEIHRTTAWRIVKRLMTKIEVEGPMASCKGLRHGFGMRAAMCRIPPNLIQRWLGHASPRTSFIYLEAVDAEERTLAERMW